MKNTILSIAALSTLLFSCSDDDSNEISVGGGVEVATCTDLAIENVEGTALDISTWTWIDADLNGAETTEALTGTLTGEMTLDASVTYSLDGPFIIAEGGKLIIPAGTQIAVEAADGEETDTYIAVFKGGEIEVNGTADNPVVMASVNGAPGDWGGLLICGEATTTAGVDAEAEVAGLKYGGTNDEDSSGVVEFLVIKGAGANILTDSQYNGLTLYAVGSGTVINAVAAINGNDDGVEFFGGTVNVTNFYAENNSDDAIDWTEGWSGSLTNAYVSHTIEDFSTAVEADGQDGSPVLENITAISTTGGKAFQFKNASGAEVINYFIDGYDNEFEAADAELFVAESVTVDGDVISTVENCDE